MPSTEELKIWSEIAQNISVTGAAVVTAYYGAKGLSAWRRELSGRAGFETARKVLKTLYETRDAILGFLDSLTLNWITYDFQNMEWKALNDKLRELEALSHEVEITFGQKIRKTGEPIWELVAAMNQMFLESEKKTLSLKNLLPYLRKPPHEYVTEGVQNIENVFVRHAR